MFMLPTTLIDTVVTKYGQFQKTAIGGYLLPKMAQIAGSTIGMAFPEVIIAQYAVGKAAAFLLNDSERKEAQVKIAAISAGALTGAAMYYDPEVFVQSATTAFALQFAGSVIGTRTAGRLMGVKYESREDRIDPEFIRQLHGAVVCEAATQLGRQVFATSVMWPIGSAIGFSSRVIARQAGYYATELLSYERGKNGYDVGELLKLYVEKTHGGADKFVAQMTRACTRLPFGEKVAGRVLTHLIDSKQGAHALVTAFNRYLEITSDPMTRALNQLVEVQPGKEEIAMLEMHLQGLLFSDLSWKERGVVKLFQKAAKESIEVLAGELCKAAAANGLSLSASALRVHAVQIATLAAVLQFGQPGGVKPVTEEENALFYRNVSGLLFGAIGEFTGSDLIEGAVHALIPAMLKHTPFVPLVLMDKEVKAVQVEELSPNTEPALPSPGRVAGFISACWGGVRAFFERLMSRIAFKREALPLREKEMEEILADAERRLREIEAFLAKNS